MAERMARHGPPPPQGPLAGEPTGILLREPTCSPWLKRAQRVRDHLRRPLGGSRNLLMETAGNTVSETVPVRRLWAGRTASALNWPCAPADVSLLSQAANHPAGGPLHYLGTGLPVQPASPLPPTTRLPPVVEDVGR